MKIIVNAFSAKLGGGQTYLRNLFAYMPIDDEIEFLVFGPDSLGLPKRPDVKIMHSKWPTDNPISRAFWELFILPFTIKTLSADLLFCPGGTINTFVPKGCKKVTMFRNMSPFDYELRMRMPFGKARLRLWILEKIMLKSMAYADLTIFISNFARNFIADKIPLKGAVTIHHGLSPQFKTRNSELERPKSNLSEKRCILYVSRFDAYKHHLEVVTAFNALPKKFKENYALSFVGETNSPEFELVKKYIDTNQLESCVNIIGPVKNNELPGLYKYADVILFASSCENCPNILLEALGAGRPILCSDIMPMPEFGEDAVMYFNPFDSKDLSLKFERILENEELKKSYGYAAGMLSEKYNWQVTAEKTLIALRSVLVSA